MLRFDPFLLFWVLKHHARIRSLRFVSGSLASSPDSIPSFCFGFSGIAPGFDPVLLFWVLWIQSLHFVLCSPTSRLDSIPSFCFGFSGIMPGFDSLFLFRVLRHRARIQSLLFVSGSLASCLYSIFFFYVGFSGIVSGFDLFFIFYFEFSNIVPGFDPFFLLLILRHRARILLSFLALCSDFPHLPRHHDPASLIFSDITSGFLLSFLVSCPDHSSSQASCSGLSRPEARETGLGLFTCFIRRWCVQVL